MRNANCRWARRFRGAKPEPREHHSPFDLVHAHQCKACIWLHLPMNLGTSYISAERTWKRPHSWERASSASARSCVSCARPPCSAARTAPAVAACSARHRANACQEVFHAVGRAANIGEDRNTPPGLVTACMSRCVACKPLFLHANVHTQCRPIGARRLHSTGIVVLLMLRHLRRNDVARTARISTWPAEVPRSPSASPTAPASQGPGELARLGRRPATPSGCPPTLLQPQP